MEVDDGPDEFEYRLHPGAPGHDIAEGEPLLVPSDGPAVGRLELLELDGPADDEQQLRRLEGLDEVVLCPQAHRFDGRLDGAVGSHHQHGEVRVLGLDLPDEFDTVHPGQAAIGEHQIHVLGFESVERFLAALRGQDFVTLELECPLQRPQEHLIVVDEQEPSLHRVPPAMGIPPSIGSPLGIAATSAGKEMRTRVPRPGVLSTVTSPPCRSMIFFTMDMPSPVPDGFVVKNGWKIRSRAPGPIPMPSSITSTVARSPSTKRLTSTRPPPRRDSMASSAFRMILVKTWRSFWPSAAATTWRSAWLYTTAIPLARPSPAAASKTGSRMRASSKTFRSSRVSRVKSRRLLMIPSISAMPARIDRAISWDRG